MTSPPRSWRDYFRPIIAEVISCCGEGCSRAFVRKAVLASWPEEQLGKREHWPYQVWLDEVRRQLDGIPFPHTKRPFVDPADPRQERLL